MKTVSTMEIQQNVPRYITICTRKMQKKDRLAAGYTLEKFERIYRQAFYDAAKKADPNWEIGKPIKDGALDSVTRELAESRKSPAQATLDTKI